VDDQSEPADAIRRRHVDFLTGHQRILLKALASGFDEEALGARLSIARSTVRRELADIGHVLFDLIGLAPSRPRLVAWFYAHEECCLRGPDSAEAET
jgi:hypothetical protein